MTEHFNQKSSGEKPAFGCAAVEKAPVKPSEFALILRDETYSQTPISYQSRLEK